MNRETSQPVEDDKIPPGFKVTFVTLRGYDSPDRWFEAFFPDGSKLGQFRDRDAAINACIGHAKTDPPTGPPGDSFEAVWQEVRPRMGCVRCLKTKNVDGSNVTWRCSVCGHLVCRECTKTIGDLGHEYHEKTYCSEDCWVADGKPFD